MAEISKILTFIESCQDAAKLKSIIENARVRREIAVVDAAFRKLIAIVPSEKPGTVEHDFWQTVHAFEYVLTEERQKTTRLARTRQKVARVGVVQTLKDWALSPNKTEGFEMLLERGMPELTGEAIVLRHPDCFSSDEQAAAREKLALAGVDIATLPMA